MFSSLLPTGKVFRNIKIKKKSCHFFWIPLNQMKVGSDQFDKDLFIYLFTLWRENLLLLRQDFQSRLFAKFSPGSIHERIYIFVLKKIIFNLHKSFRLAFIFTGSYRRSCHASFTNKPLANASFFNKWIKFNLPF